MASRRRFIDSICSFKNKWKVVEALMFLSPNLWNIFNVYEIFPTRINLWLTINLIETGRKYEWTWIKNMSSMDIGSHHNWIFANKFIANNVILLSTFRFLLLCHLQRVEALWCWKVSSHSSNLPITRIR